MTITERQEIKAYLSGPRNYAEGVRLYDRFGHNLMFKRRFMLEDTEFSRSLLLEELRKLAGLSEADLRRLPRRAHTATAASEPVIAEEKAESAVNKEAPATVRKMITFRERYPFLASPDCPDILKVLVSDLFTAYDSYKSAFARLQESPDEATEQTVKDAETLVESYLTNREIWAELDHYRDTGTILGKAARFQKPEPAEDLTTLSDIELLKKLSSARSNQSKQRTLLKEAEAQGKDTATALEGVARWTATREALEAEIDRRKKNC